MVGWHQQHNGHEFEQIPEDGEGQAAVHKITKSQTQLRDWTTTTIKNSRNDTRMLI